jgi:16S rRNA (guanine527-N7)-methyltransferase
MSFTAETPAGAELAGLVARLGLDAGQQAQLTELAQMLEQDGRAPTTVREPLAVVRDHLADSLVALELDHVPWDGHIADLGAGAGLPGLPLAIARPAARVTLVESNTKKCDFLARAASACDLGNVEVVRERAELWRDGLEQCDVVTARALAALPVVVEYAAPLLRVGGALVAWRGQRDAREETMGAIAAAELGLEPLDVVIADPYPQALHRHLHVMIKLRPTSARFPRRLGVARKHPLGRIV